MFKNKYYFFSVLVFYLLIINSCAKNEIIQDKIDEVVIDTCLIDGKIISEHIIIQAPHCTDFNYGIIDLTPCSYKAIPYKKDTVLIYEDETNNQINFNLISSEPYPFYRSSYSLRYCNWDTLFPYVIEGKRQSYEFYLETYSEKVDLFFSIDLGKANVGHGDEMIFSECITIFKFNKEFKTLDYTLICLDTGDYFNGFNCSDFSHEYTLNDKVFKNVYFNYEEDLFYNYQYGLIGFKDKTQNLWVLKTQ